MKHGKVFHLQVHFHANQTHFHMKCFAQGLVLKHSHKVTWNDITLESKYLLLTEFEGRTVSYGPSFFPLRYMAQARSTRAINRRGKKRVSVTYSTDRENEVSKIFVISLPCVWRLRNDFYPRGTASNYWRTSKAKRINLKSFFKSLACFNAQFKVEKSFKIFPCYKS